MKAWFTPPPCFACRLVLLPIFLGLGLFLSVSAQTGGSSGAEPCNEYLGLFTPSVTTTTLNEEFTLAPLITSPDFTYRWDVYGMASEFGWDKADPGRVWAVCGEGTKTITLTLVDNRNGCVHTESHTVEIQRCPNIKQVLVQAKQEQYLDGLIKTGADNYLVSGLIKVKNGTSLTLEGRFLFDGKANQDPNKPGGTLTTMGKIKVESGGHLIIEHGSILKAYCKAMWDGIEVEDGGKLTILGQKPEISEPVANRTILRDMWNGIYKHEGILAIPETYSFGEELFQISNSRIGISASKLDRDTTFSNDGSLLIRSDYQGFFPPYSQCHNESNYGDFGHFFTEKAVEQISNNPSLSPYSYVTRVKVENALVGYFCTERANVQAIQNTFINCVRAGIFMPSSLGAHFYVEGCDFFIPDNYTETQQTKDFQDEQTTAFPSLDGLSRTDHVYGIFSAGPRELFVDSSVGRRCRFIRLPKPRAHQALTFGIHQGYIEGLRYAYFEDLDYGIYVERDNSPQYQASSTWGFDVLNSVFKNNQYGIYYAAGTDSVYSVGLACNEFISEGTPANTRYGMFIEDGFKLKETTWSLGTWNIFDVKPNVWPVVFSGGASRDVLPGTTDVEASGSGWASPPNWVSIRDENTNVVKYQRFDNEFVGVVEFPNSTSGPIVSRYQIGPNFPLTYTSANTTIPTNGLQACQNNYTPTYIVYPTRMGRPTGLQSNVGKSSFIFPNPASDVVNIQGEGIVKVQLIDLSGRQLAETTYASEGSVRFNLPKVQAGLYSLRVVLKDNTVFTQKLSIQ